MRPNLPKPIFFGLLGFAGCLAGWAIGELPLSALHAAHTAPDAGGDPSGPGPSRSLIFSNPAMQHIMDERGARAGSMIIGLTWNNYNDLDLHCIDPSGEEIFYKNKKSNSGGELDLDCNFDTSKLENPGAEHIRWAGVRPPPGRYQVFVQYYSNHGGQDPTSYEGEIALPGQRIPLRGTLSTGERSEVTTVTVPEETPGSGIVTAANARAVDTGEVLLVGAFGALLAIPLGAALVIGQNVSQHRPLLQKKQLITVSAGGILAGFVAGAGVQYLFASLAQGFGSFGGVVLLDAVQVLGWALFGLLLAITMSVFIPNLPRRYAAAGGAVGGGLGGLVLVLSLGSGLGRALGAATLGLAIGAMIAWVEELAREAALVVHWGPNERTIINLGPRPVILGSSPEADLYLPKEKGFPPVTALVTFQEGSIQIDNKVSNSKHQLHNGSKLRLGDLEVEVQAK